MRTKYGNRKTVIDNITFDSRAEASRYQELKLLLAAGEITDLELQPEFELVPSFRVNGRTERAIKYRADFSYFDVTTGWKTVEDVKGTRTAAYLIKRKLLLYRHRGFVFREVEA